MSVPTSATPLELVASILADLPLALPTTMTATGPAPTAGNDLYEGYLFGLVLRAARLEGYLISLADSDGPATILRLRRAPGRLPSAGPPGGRFTHAVLSYAGSPDLELHTGVGVAGKSKVVHEADVCLLPAVTADRCRALNIDPAGHDAEVVIEAKYYTNPVGLGTGREFLGFCADISSKRKIFVATVANVSVVHLLAGRSIDHDTGVLPRRAGERNILGLIQRILRGYRSRL
jgi:hypothetical protein